MLIWVCSHFSAPKIRSAQHWGRRVAHLSENKSVKSECKKFGENSRQMAPVSTICDEYCNSPISKSWGDFVKVKNSRKKDNLRAPSKTGWPSGQF